MTNTFFQKPMTLRDVLRFFLNYNSHLPEHLILWLREYRFSHQVSFIYFLVGQVGQVNITQTYIAMSNNAHQNCRCRKLYEQLGLSAHRIPLEAIARCAPENWANHIPVQTLNLVGSIFKFSENNLLTQQYKEPFKFREDTYIPDNNTESTWFVGERLSVYGVHQLVKKKEFRIDQVLSYFDVFDLFVFLILSNYIKCPVPSRCIERFLPEYLRASRMEKNSADFVENAEMTIMTRLYNFFNRQIYFTSVPQTTFSFREFEMKTTKEPLPDDGQYICQLKYSGNKCYINVVNGKIYIFDDFGRKISLSSNLKGVTKEVPFLIECVRITKGLMFRSGFIEGNHIFVVTDVLILNNVNYITSPFAQRAKLIPELVQLLANNCFVEAAAYEMNRLAYLTELYQMEVSNDSMRKAHFSGVVYKHISKNIQIKYNFSKNKFTFLSKEGSSKSYITDESFSGNIGSGILIADVEPNFSAYMLARSAKVKSKIILFIFDGYEFVEWIHVELRSTIILPTTYRRKIGERKSEGFAIVQVGFNRIDGCEINDIVSITAAPSKHIFNVLTMSQLSSKCEKLS